MHISFQRYGSVLLPHWAFAIPHRWHSSSHPFSRTTSSRLYLQHSICMPRVEKLCEEQPVPQEHVEATHTRPISWFLHQQYQWRPVLPDRWSSSRRWIQPVHHTQQCSTIFCLVESLRCSWLQAWEGAPHFWSHWVYHCLESNDKRAHLVPCTWTQHIQQWGCNLCWGSLSRTLPLFPMETSLDSEHRSLHLCYFMVIRVRKLGGRSSRISICWKGRF